MELHYDITKQDYIDFNLNYYTNNAVVQRSILTTRIASAVIVALGGADVLAQGAERGIRCRIFGACGGLFFRHAVVYEAEGCKKCGAHPAKGQQQAALRTQNIDPAGK